MKKIYVLVIALAMLVAFTGVVMADTGVPAVPEHQGIATTTIANVDGTVMESDATAMTLTNNPTVVHSVTSAVGINTGLVVAALTPAQIAQLNGWLAQLTALGGTATWHINPVTGTIWIDSLVIPDAAIGVPMVANPFFAAGAPWAQAYAVLVATPGFTAADVNQGIHGGMLSPGQVQYSTTYDLDIVNQAGTTAMQKTNTITTANTLAGQKNLNMPLSMTFIATADGGNSHGVEDIMLDGAATAQSTSSTMLCPFGPSVVGPVIPPFCNIVQAGGAWDLTVGSVTTAADEHFIQTDATNPVTLNYQINVKPYGTTEGQIPAIGSASAYYKLHTQEGRTASNTVSQDMTSSESSSVSGVIMGFTKIINYQSGPKLV